MLEFILYQRREPVTKTPWKAGEFEHLLITALSVKIFFLLGSGTLLTWFLLLGQTFDFYVPPLSSCVTLGKLFQISEPQFPHM